MITPFDIKLAVNNLLLEKIPSVPLKAQDVSKGFTRPSMTVELDDVKIETLECQIEMSLTVRTFYFPDLKDNEKSIDVLTMQFLLAQTYGNKIYVADRALNVNEPNAVVTDGILVHEFNTLFYQEVEEEELPMMIETLVYNGEWG